MKQKPKRKTNYWRKSGKYIWYLQPEFPPQTLLKICRSHVIFVIRINPRVTSVALLKCTFDWLIEYFISSSHRKSTGQYSSVQVQGLLIGFKPKKAQWLVYIGVLLYLIHRWRIQPLTSTASYQTVVHVDDRVVETFSSSMNQCCWSVFWLYKFLASEKC